MAETISYSNRIEGWKAVDIIPLSEAVLCADCNFITKTINHHCVACGSKAVVHVDALIRGNAWKE